ncbi:MAG: formate--tetrahydrofolate ligase [Candidatus Melainabacteria bacterium]|nr:formate--tetrahydrofolate ligase [Candidatus Melainabacteria bacterium]
MIPITEIAKKLGLSTEEIEPYGHHAAKLSMETINKTMEKPLRGKLILVTATTPTKAGEGKTTMSIGLAQALCRLKKNAVAALREPSMGPVFGMKGGATGAGKSQLVPAADINLHFTGDIHAITAANNLIAACVDNELHFRSKLNLDPLNILHRRVMDMNDRALRNIVLGLGGKINGVPREAGFDITAASEVMAVLCLSENMAELRSRLGKIVIGMNLEGNPISVYDLEIVDALLAILAHAIKPNLVQTTEGTPAFLHGGPFGNIAHGTSSLIATKIARRLSDFVITECGFGADLGFEKFCDIVASPRQKELTPDAVVLVTTARALKLHGGANAKELDKENIDALISGLANLARHVSIVKKSGLPFVIGINRFLTDSANELEKITEYCRKNGWSAAVGNPFDQGGEGLKELGELILSELKNPAQFKPFYNYNDTLENKLDSLVKNVYGGNKVVYLPKAQKQLSWLKSQGYNTLPICVSKTQYSFSDDPSLLNAPENFSVEVREFKLSAGAGFVVALTGELMAMPGLPKRPSACEIKTDDLGNISNMA